MFPNLKGEMSKRGVTAKKLSIITGIPYSTLSPKLRGENQMTLKDAQLIQTALGTKMSLDVLFSNQMEE